MKEIDLNPKHVSIFSVEIEDKYLYRTFKFVPERVKKLWCFFISITTPEHYIDNNSYDRVKLFN